MVVVVGVGAMVLEVPPVALVPYHNNKWPPNAVAVNAEAVEF